MGDNHLPRRSVILTRLRPMNRRGGDRKLNCDELIYWYARIQQVCEGRPARKIPLDVPGQMPWEDFWTRHLDDP